jgi:hypothetical protein
VISFNPKNLIGNLVEFLHLAFSQECAEILNILSFFENPSDHEFFLVFFDLIPVVISDRFVFPTVFLLLGLVFQGLSDFLFRDILIGRLSYSTLTYQHVLDSLIGVDQVPYLSLWE